MKFQRTGFLQGKQVLAGSHFQMITAGATLKEAVVVGQVVARESVSGLWVKFVGDNSTQYDLVGISLEEGAIGDVVGEVLIDGKVYKDKLVGFDPVALASNPNIFLV